MLDIKSVEIRKVCFIVIANVYLRTRQKQFIQGLGLYETLSVFRTVTDE